MQKSDELGNYFVNARWIDAWTGKNSVDGWCICEARQYVDGTIRIFRGEPFYLHELKDPARYRALHEIFIIASTALGA